MNIYRLIAGRIAQAKHQQSFSSTAGKIAIISIGVGVGLLLIAFAVLGGFKEEVQRRLFSFGGHIRLKKYSNNVSYEETPIQPNRSFYKQQSKYDYIDHIQVYGQKTGVVRANENVMGVVIKGISQDYRFKDFQPNLTQGRFPNVTLKHYAKEALISQSMADKLKLKIGDDITFIFIQNPPRFRKLKVVGIYNTGIEGFDDKLVISDIRMIQKLNGWGDSLVSGYEVFIKDFDKINETALKIDEEIDHDIQQELITHTRLDIFDWLLLLDQNVLVFLVIILCVASFNMISVLIIMMMERIQMIGSLKALGASNKQIRKIFIQRGFILLFKGMLWGNIFGIGICAIQHFLHIIPLDPSNYYMSTVPISWAWGSWFLMNLGFAILIMLVIIIPTFVISGIKPIKAIKFS